MTSKTSEARKRANKKWREKNREKDNYYKAKSATKMFILNKMEDKDIEEIKGYLEERIKRG